MPLMRCSPLLTLFDPVARRVLAACEILNVPVEAAAKIMIDKFWDLKDGMTDVSRTAGLIQREYRLSRWRVDSDKPADTEHDIKPEGPTHEG